METIHLYNLSNLCRVCLSQTEVMSNLFDSTKGIYDIFAKIVDFELERNESFPNFLCSNCESKIILCHEFLTQCKKTNDLLTSYKERDFKTEDDSKLSFNSLPVTEIIGYVSNDDNSNDSKNFHEGADMTGKNIRKLRLKQFPYEDVMKAIEDLKSRFNTMQTCTKCNFQGRNTRALAVHMAFIHKETKGRWCMYCNEVFEDLKGHKHTNEEKDGKCKFCDKIFKGRGRLLEHLRCHTEQRPFQCELCKKSFVSARHLRVHYRSHTNEKPYSCTLCPTSFSQISLLRAHVKKYHKDDNNFYCNICKKSFEAEDLCKTHTCKVNLEVVEENVPDVIVPVIIKQNYCGVCCKNVRSLTIHNKNYHDVKKEVEDPVIKLCTVCGKQFKNHSHLRVHMRVHTGETPYSCSYCNRKMATRNHLVVHERTHTGEKPHICPVCKKGFSQTSILNTHMKLHTGRPEVCMICNKRFCRPAELRLHLRKHTGEKPFVCQYCGRTFVQKSHLVEHTNRHLEEKPYRCGVCGNGFRQRYSLKTHMQIHTGEKPYKCSQCPYACRQSYSLTVHMKQHTDDAPRVDRPHTCTFCHKNYTTLAMLNSHIGNAHTVIKSE